MEQNERVAVIRKKFPGYTKPLDSMCKRPEYYGIRRTAEAEALIADKPGRNREANYKLSVRIPFCSRGVRVSIAAISCSFRIS